MSHESELIPAVSSLPAACTCIKLKNPGFGAGKSDLDCNLIPGLETSGRHALNYSVRIGTGVNLPQ